LHGTLSAISFNWRENAFINPAHCRPDRINCCLLPERAALANLFNSNTNELPSLLVIPISSIFDWISSATLSTISSKVTGSGATPCWIIFCLGVDLGACITTGSGGFS